MSAKSNVPWSVKGIDPDARSVAKELARRKGMTLGEWMTAMIREKGIDETGESSGDQAGGKTVSGVTTDQLRGVIDTLNRLNERLKSAEKHLQTTEMQSREAMGGLNQGLETVFERVKRLEKENKFAEAPQDIADRLERLEGAQEKGGWVRSLVALERALTTLVEQVETSREETEDRLTRNEDLITALQERLNEEDEALRSETAGLLDAIDQTTSRLADTEDQVREALDLARKAAESRDETFIERTSQRLQLLGNEIKRTSDHIRTLEGQVGRLSEKIEAGEERSAEGISRVAQSLESLRREVEETSLADGGSGSTQAVRTAVEEADRRVGALQGAFAAVVDRLEGRLPQTGHDAGLGSGVSITRDDTPPPPPEAFFDDFTETREEEDDPFDRAFGDPLGFSPEPEPVEPRRDDSELRRTDGGTNGLEPDRRGESFFARPEHPALFGDPGSLFEPEQRNHEPELPPKAPEPPRFDTGDDEDDGWEPASSFVPTYDDERDGDRYDRDDPFGDDRPLVTERLSAAFRNAVGRPVENNPPLGWLLIAVVVAAIAFTGLRLAAPGDVEPVFVEPMVEPAPQEQARPSAATLYAEAKTRLVTATTESETASAVAALTRAAEAGSVPAQYDLGELYLSGDSVPENGVLARRWFSEAADAGHIRAVHRVAYLDINGVGGPVDSSRAIDGFTAAANAGLTAAMFNLGTLFDPSNEYLTDSLRDAETSYYWFRLAELQGDEKAAAQADALVSRLAPTVRDAADARAAAWAPTPISR